MLSRVHVLPLLRQMRGGEHPKALLFAHEAQDVKARVAAGETPMEICRAYPERLRNAARHVAYGNSWTRSGQPLT